MFISMHTWIKIWINTWWWCLGGTSNMTFEGAFLSRKVPFLERPIGSNNVATHTSFHNHPKYL